MKLIKWIFYVFLFVQCSNIKEKNRLFSLSKLFFSNFPKVYFSYPGRFTPEVKKQKVRKEILSFIKSTENQMNIRAYSFNDKDIIQNLIYLKQKGIKINFIGDTKSHYSDVLKKYTNFHSWNGGGLHHIKLILLDKKRVFTGTGNFTEHGLLTDYNGYISFNLGNKNTDFVSFLNERIPFFENNKILFLNSPSFGRQVQSFILREIEKAHFSIEYLIFDHFDTIISLELKKASERNVIVKGIYNAPVDKEGKYLADHFFGIHSNIYEEKNEDKVWKKTRYLGGLLHHKTLIIDGKLVLSGSYNFSRNARDKNREIFFKIPNLFIANEYRKEFQRVQKKSHQLLKTKFQRDWDDFSDISKIQENEICFQDTFGNEIIVELGNKFFKTYFLYSLKNKERCIPINKYQAISSGFSYYFSYVFWKDTGLWKNRNVYSKNSFKREIVRSSSHPIFDSNKDLDFVSLTFLDKKNFIFQTETKQDFSEVYAWFFGREMENSKISYNEEYSFFTLKKSPMPSEGVLFFIGKDKNYVTCYRRKRKKHQMIEFFLKHYIIFQKTERNINYQNISCFTYTE